MGTFQNQHEALALVSNLPDARGDAYADVLDLGCTRDDDFRLVATGSSLAMLAHAGTRHGALTSAGGGDR